MTWFSGFVLAMALASPQSAPLRLNEEVKSLLEQNRSADAVVVARRAVASSEATVGHRHPVTAMIIRNLALAYERCGSYKRAEAEARESLRILESWFGTRDESLVAPLNVLTEVFADQGRYMDAMRMARRAIAIGPGAGMHYATAVRNLNSLNEITGRRFTPINAHAQSSLRPY
jgi:tetratricopeptide (TPR) repeat protein